MLIWRDVPGATTTPRETPSAITIGNFDGVHRGHRHVLEATRESARGGEPVVAVTFDPHPLAVVAPAYVPRRLTTLERRIELLHEAGADEVRVLAFSAEMAAWTPEEFVRRVLVESLRAAHLAVGDNFRFGHKAAGDVAYLREVGPSLGFTVDGLALDVRDGGDVPFSSTLVRTLVAEGDLRGAAEVLGRPHEVGGVVVRGDRRGRELGFPTANVPVDETYAVPPDGVYAGWVVRGTERGRAEPGDRLPAAISVGSNPTFDGTERRVESYVLDRPITGGVADLDLYGEAIRVELVERLRGMVKYEGLEALVEQMHDDVAQTRVVLGL